MMRFLNKIASWSTIYVIYLILKIQEFWNKLNFKAIALTLAFWVIFVLFIKYFFHVVAIAIFVGGPIFLLLFTYKIFCLILEGRL